MKNIVRQCGILTTDKTIDKKRTKAPKRLSEATTSESPAAAESQMQNLETNLHSSSNRLNVSQKEKEKDLRKQNKRRNDQGKRNSSGYSIC
jgi:hypothetical protein